ncbi:MAG: hypothetical protein ACLQT6_06990 [Desulfomonilaceae bacterium]
MEPNDATKAWLQEVSKMALQSINYMAKNVIQRLFVDATNNAIVPRFTTYRSHKLTPIKFIWGFTVQAF